MSAEMTGKESKLIGNTVLSDEIIARFNTYDQGRTEKGYYWELTFTQDLHREEAKNH